MSITLGISEKRQSRWTRDWSDPSTCPQPGEVGEWRNKLISRNPGWNDVLEKASKAPGSKVKKI